MYIFDKNSQQWEQAHNCKFPPLSSMIKIEDDDKIIIVAKDDLLKIVQYLSGEKEIPDISNSEDILGDIENCDCDSQSTYFYQYFECTVEELKKDESHMFRRVNSFFSYGKITIHRDNDGDYMEERYPCRKGYPSYFMKI